MRHWLLHPLVFYPLVAVAALLLVAISLKPQAWPRAPAAVAGAEVNGALVLAGDALGAPESDPAQHIFVDRDFWGRALSLRIAILPRQTAPTPSDTGVRILLAPEAGSALQAGAVAEVTYNPSAVNAASGLALSLQGADATQWVTATLEPQPGVVRFTLPAQTNPTALGLRAITSGADQAYGVEITRIRLLPR